MYHHSLFGEVLSELFFSELLSPVLFLPTFIVIFYDTFNACTCVFIFLLVDPSLKSDCYCYLLFLFLYLCNGKPTSCFQIILSQEKNIQRLNELVQSLQLQLLQCRGSNNTINDTGSSFTANGNEIENKHMLED